MAKESAETDITKGEEYAKKILLSIVNREKL